MIPQGADPHTYEPKPKDMADIERAKLYFAVGGIEMEKIWLDRFRKRFPNMKIVNTSEGIAMKGGHVHDHETRDHHGDHGVDPHVWLSPPLVMLQSRTIYQALVEADPQGKAIYDEGFSKWMAKLVNLDIELTSILSPFKGRTFLVYHPAWGYFAEAYGLKQLAVEREGKAPGPKDFKTLQELVAQQGIKILFDSSEVPQVAAKNAARELRLDVDVLNPLVYDWENNIRAVAKKLVSSWTTK
jgi:zinc transport system substrate-binding protein